MAIIGQSCMATAAQILMSADKRHGILAAKTGANGYCTRMSERTWHVRRSAPVRADADSIFIPESDAPGATISDRIIFENEDGSEHTARVVEATDREGEPYLRVELG